MTSWQQNNQGFTLTWVVIAFLVLLIFLGGILTMAVGYHGRSINNNAQQQAYFTARSVVNAVAQDICGTESRCLLPQDTDGKLQNLPVNGLPGAMGSATVNIYRNGNVVFVEAIATAGGQSSTVVARIDKYSSNSQLPTNFNYLVLGAQGGKSMELRGLRTNTDLLIPEGIELVTLGNANGRSFWLEGKLYTQSPLLIQGYDVSAFIRGKITSTADITIQNSRLNIGLESKPTEIYTTGNVTVNGMEGAIYGSVTAYETIQLANWPTVTYDVRGNLYAANILLSNGSSILGNVTASGNNTEAAPALTLKDSAKIKGNVTAQSLSINQGAKITGNVAASSIIINTNQGAAIIGNVTTKTLTIGNNTYKAATELPDGINEWINGAVTFASPDIPAPPSEKLSFPILPEVTIARPAADRLVPAEPEGNRLVLGSYDQLDPEDPEPPDSKKEVIVAADRHYHLSKDLPNANILVQGSGKVFLHVDKGVKLQISRLQYQQFVGGRITVEPQKEPQRGEVAPNLFIQLEDTAEVELNATNWSNMQSDFYCYIDARKNATAALIAAQSININLYGGLHCAVFADSLGSNIYYIDPKAGNTDDGEEQERWILTQYLPSLPRAEVNSK